VPDSHEAAAASGGGAPDAEIDCGMIVGVARTQGRDVASTSWAFVGSVWLCSHSGGPVPKQSEVAQVGLLRQVSIRGNTALVLRLLYA